MGTKRNKSEWVRGMGVAFEIVKAIADAVHAGGGSDDDLRLLVQNRDKIRRIAEIILDKPAATSPAVAQLTPASPTFSAFVEYVCPALAALKSMFDWVNDDYGVIKFEPIDICKSVPTNSHDVEFVYVHLNRDASTATALAELNKLGLRPALYQELLAFAAKYPEEQRKFPIVALGSVAVLGGRRRVAYVGGGGRERCLGLGWVDGGGWLRRCRFLAVRK